MKPKYVVVVISSFKYFWVQIKSVSEIEFIFYYTIIITTKHYVATFIKT